MSEAPREPTAPGVNVAEAAQAAPAAREDPQVVVKPKSVTLAPESRMLPMLTGFDPMFERITVCAALDAPNFWEKTRAGVLSDTVPGTPVPFKAKVCGEPATESAKLRVAERVPGAVGTKLMETPQLAPAARTDPQVVVMRKSEDAGPASQILEMLVGLPPGLESTTVWDALVVQVP